MAHNTCLHEQTHLAAEFGEARAHLAYGNNRDRNFHTREGRSAQGAAAEMALHVLAYNLTRVMNIMGSRRLIAAMHT